MMSNPEVQIAVVPPQRRLEALRVLLADFDLGSAERSRVAAELLAKADPHELAGLFEGRRQMRTVGAVWVQRQPGATALVWPPALGAGQDETIARRLLSAACRFLDRHQVVLAQSLLDRGGGPPAKHLAAAGFSPLADLDYLVCDQSRYPMVRPAAELDLAPYRRTNHERLLNVVLRTYEGTLDCPRMSGVRDIDAVLAGYRATGRFRASHWLVARHGNSDIGCLLLADHPAQQQLELVYMGVVPEARGVGWGLTLTRYAQWFAYRAERPRLVLAVDRRNLPALAVYHAAGFTCWTKRHVWTRSGSGRCVAPV